jgi:hypothetical protein
MRPSLDQIENHAFFTNGSNLFVPDVLPLQFLNIAPSDE